MCSQGTRRGISRGTTCRTRRLSASAGARTEARSTSWARPLPAAALIRPSLCSNATHSADVVRSCPAGDGLTTFNFTSPAHWTTLGFSFGPWGGSYFNGYMANVGLWRRPIDDSEVSCLYKCKRDFLSIVAFIFLLADEKVSRQTARLTSGSRLCKLFWKTKHQFCSATRTKFNQRVQSPGHA